MTKLLFMVLPRHLVRRMLGVVAAEDAGADAVDAVGLASRMGAELKLLALLPEGESPSGLEAGRLRQTLRSVNAAHPPDVRFAEGRLAVEAAHIASDPRVDILLVGRHAAEGDPRLLDDLLFRARVPVLVAGVGRTGEGPVLAALDGEERGAAVAMLAGEFASRMQRALAVVTVDDPADAMPDGLLPPRAARASRLLERLVDSSSAHRALLRAPVQSRVGDVGREVAAVAEALRASVLVMGRRTGSASGTRAHSVMARWHGPTLLLPI